MTNTEANKELVRRFVRLGNDRDLDGLGEIVAPDFARHCPATPDVDVRSFDDFRRFLEVDSATFPDSTVTMHELVAEGDLVAFWATYAGTQEGPMGPFPPSGRRMEVDFGGVFRIESGKIVHLRLTWDNVSALTQLGHFPPPDVA